MVSNRSHTFVMVSVFEVWSCIEKIENEHVISLAPLKVMTLLEFITKNAIFWYFLYALIPKNHSPESKYSENPSLVLTYLIQIII